ncbi:MAG: acyltransferase [Frankiaceae bacterium]|nr:acyltransferase [Frankiaceae bacterium]MBV9871475.1 acyltransferase [Frankiaceae bacterium]
MTAPATSRRLGYRPELDGVRGLAVLCIFGFHMAFIWWPIWHVAKGGFLSVDIFFVLSGMLITEILLNDFERYGAVNLGSFYQRRARRLLPALVAFVVVSVLWYQVVHGTGGQILRGVASVITYVASGQFATSVHNPPGVGQMWTLVVEWIFYFTWPLVLVLLLRSGRSIRTIGYVAAAGALAAALVRAVTYHRDPNYVLSYHLSWLRFEDLLAGSAIGLLGGRPQAPSWLRTGGLAFLVFGTAYASISAEWVYAVGMLLAALATAVIVQPREQPWWFDRVLRWPPVVWIGTVSYSFYLWSVFTVSEVSHNLNSWPTAIQLALATVLSFVLAWASYTFIENPLRVRSRRSAVPTGVSTGDRPSRRR